jgi:hypothetical protein
MTNHTIDDIIRVLKTESDKAAEHKKSAEADGTSDYDYWEGYLTAIDLAIDLLHYDLIL